MHYKFTIVIYPVDTGLYHYIRLIVEDLECMPVEPGYPMSRFIFNDAVSKGKYYETILLHYAHVKFELKD